MKNLLENDTVLQGFSELLSPLTYSIIDPWLQPIAGETIAEEDKKLVRRLLRNFHSIQSKQLKTMENRCWYQFLQSKEEVSGILLFWTKDQTPTPEQIKIFTTMVQYLNQTLNTAKKITLLQQQKDEITSRVDFISHFSLDILRHENNFIMVLDSLLKQIMFTRKVDGGYILIHDREEGNIDTDQNIPDNVPIESLKKWVFTLQSCRYINENATINHLLETNSPFTGLLGCPFDLPNGNTGWVILWKTTGGVFQPVDHSFMNLVTGTLLLQHEHFELDRRNQEKERYEQDLFIAQQVQSNLLPSSVPKMKNLSIGAFSIMAKSVGGDFYDFYRSGPETLVFAVGDISGKSIPAALLQILVQRVLREGFLSNLPLNQLMIKINQDLFDSLVELNMFVTLFLAEINVRTGVLRYANAGHNYPLHYHNNTKKVAPFTTFGMPLGFLKDCAYESGSHTMSQNDVVLIYTDGLTEVFNENRDPYPDERLYEIFAKNAAEKPEKIITELILDVEDFSTDSVLRDDRTLLVFRYESQEWYPKI